MSKIHKLKTLLYILGLFYCSKKFLICLLRFYRLLRKKKKNLIERYGKNSYALISGATNVIGKEIARQLAMKGFNLILLSSEDDMLNSIAKDLKRIVPERDIIPFSAKLEESNNHELFNQIQQKLANLDISILVNNTDVDNYDEFHNTKLRQCKSMIFINCIPPILLTRTMLPQLLKRPHKSAIINVSCGAAIFPMAYYSLYVGTKALVDTFTKSITLEFPELDIMLYNPFDIVESKEGNENYDMMTITAEESVREALNDLGSRDKTYGHWKHKFQGAFYEKIPRWLFKYVYLKMVAPQFLTEGGSAYGLISPISPRKKSTWQGEF